MRRNDPLAERDAGLGRLMLRGVDVLMLADGSAPVSWFEPTAKGGKVKVR